MARACCRSAWSPSVAASSAAKSSAASRPMAAKWRAASSTTVPTTRRGSCAGRRRRSPRYSATSTSPSSSIATTSCCCNGHARHGPLCLVAAKRLHWRPIAAACGTDNEIQRRTTMAIMDRIKGMLLSPRTEWPKVAAEPASVQSIYTGWVMILGLLGPIAILLLSSVFFGAFGVLAAVASYVNTLVGIAIIALIADLIAPTFGGTRDYVAALKLVAYAATAIWIAQIALIVPVLGALVALAGA